MAKKKRKTELNYPDIESWISAQPKEQRKALRAALKCLRKLYQENRSTDLMWWYEVGVQVKKFFPEGRNYGANVTVLLAKHLTAVDNKVKGLSALYWRARKVARNLNKTEARAWSKKRNAKGDALSAYHALKLISIEDKKQRSHMLTDCLKENWSVARLEKEVQNAFGHLRSGGRRKPNERPVPTPRIALREIKLNSEAWIKNHKMWFKGAKSSLRRVPKKEQTDNFYLELEKAVVGLLKMQIKIDEALDQLQQLVKEVASRLETEQ